MDTDLITKRGKMINTITSGEKTVNRISDFSGLAHPICPFCGSSFLLTVCLKNRVDKCAECNQAFRQMFLEKNREIYKRKPPMPSWLESRAAAKHHYNFITANIDLKKIETVLEIGAGDGFLLKEIRNKNDHLNITAVEPSGGYCQTLSRISGITVIEDFIENIDFNEKFDLIIMSHVLEHIEEPLTALKQIYKKLLADGGYLYIDIPNQDYEIADNNTAAKAPLTHLYFFNGANMPELLSHAGFHEKPVYGVKYKMLPASYGYLLGLVDKLGCSNAGKYLIYLLKMINKLSLFMALVLRNMFNIMPDEIPMESVNRHFNNMAIMARKQ